MRVISPYHTPDLVLGRIVHGGLIAIIRGNFSSDRILRVAEILQVARINILEVTLNSADALTHIEALRDVLPETVLVGAGTVRTAKLVERAHDAGAQFALSPSLDQDTVRSAQRLGLLLIPGVMTPTEVESAVALGCSVVKLFPVSTGGVHHFGSLRTVFEDVGFIPTGGMNAENIGAYRRAGAVAIGVGSALVSDRSGADEDLLVRATAIRRSWEESL